MEPYKLLSAGELEKGMEIYDGKEWNKIVYLDYNDETNHNILVGVKDNFYDVELSIYSVVKVKKTPREIIDEEPLLLC